MKDPHCWQVGKGCQAQQTKGKQPRKRPGRRSKLGDRAGRGGKAKTGNAQGGKNGVEDVQEDRSSKAAAGAAEGQQSRSIRMSRT